MKIALNQTNQTNKGYNKQQGDKVVKLPMPQKPVKTDSVTFKGATGVITDNLSKMMGSIENSGFLGEFLIIDTISMILPRIAVGLNRDREKTGQINYKAGAEEAGREILSGPSMMFIPMGIFYGLSKMMPGASVTKKTFNYLSDSLNGIIKNASNTELLKDSSAIKKQLASNMFENAFADHSFNNKTALKQNFVDELTATRSTKRCDKKEAVKNFEKLVKDISNSNKNGLSASSTVLKFKDAKNENVDVNAKQLYKDFENYTKDVVKKVTKKASGSTLDSIKKVASDSLSSMTKYRGGLRALTSLASFAAVGVFLIKIPKLYLRSSTSPAMESANLASGKTETTEDTQKTKEEKGLKGGQNENI